MWTLHLCPKCIKMNTCNMKTLCFHSQTHSNVFENKGLGILSYARPWKHNGFLGFVYVLVPWKGVIIYHKGSLRAAYSFTQIKQHLAELLLCNVLSIYIISVYYIWIYIYIHIYIYHRQYNVTYLAESTTFHVGVYSILVLYIVLGMYIIDQVYNTVGMIYKY